MRQDVRIVIIGGGPAGLAAAAAAAEQGVPVGDILIIERDDKLGGILNQCIHNGFGLHTFREELTGPEYAQRYIDLVEKDEIPYLLNTIVVDISKSKEKSPCGGHAGAAKNASRGYKTVTAMNSTDGMIQIRAEAVILAMGCRERPRGALNIPGYRPAGIYTAGTAQRFVNIEGRMPGREVVILGSGDIGLIMARRMTLEGAKVKVVAELMPYSGGLKRNIVQCLDDFGIPLKLSHTVVDIRGRDRVEGVTIAEVGPDRKPIPGTEEYYSCDTLLLSCGLIPENELSDGLGVGMNPVTNGPKVNESLETDVPGVFACGNVLHVHDLVDYVSEEATAAGACAARYVLEEETGAAGKQETGAADKPVTITATDGVRYTVPVSIHVNRMQETQRIRFRVGAVYRDAAIEVDFDGRPFRTWKKRIMAPGEMEQVILTKKDLAAAKGLRNITIRVVQGG
jgi:NADPH-dependent 2,4-dienoyl-CoA reductase/sulfur reductase-like enzyme